jgi:hypothetical protein
MRRIADRICEFLQCAIIFGIRIILWLLFPPGTVSADLKRPQKRRF